MPKSDAERLGLTPKPRDERAAELDEKYGKPVSTSDEPVALSIPDEAPAPKAVVSDEPVDLSKLTLADIGTKITTIDQLNQLLGAHNAAREVKPYTPPGRTERQNEQLLAEQEAGRKRVAFYEQQKISNPKPVDPRDVEQNRSTPVFQSGEARVKERDPSRF